MRDFEIFLSRSRRNNYSRPTAECSVANYTSRGTRARECNNGEPSRGVQAMQLVKEQLATEDGKATRLRRRGRDGFGYCRNSRGATRALSLASSVRLRELVLTSLRAHTSLTDFFALPPALYLSPRFPLTPCYFRSVSLTPPPPAPFSLSALALYI